VLREQAEKLLSEKKTPMPPHDAQKVLHELEVHQIELEMQNEALRQGQATLAGLAGKVRRSVRFCARRLLYF